MLKKDVNFEISGTLQVCVCVCVYCFAAVCRVTWQVTAPPKGHTPG